MNLKGIGKKIIKRDFSCLLGFGNGNRNVHPTEVAKMPDAVPVHTALQAFTSLPTSTQTKVFPYLDNLLQSKIIKNIFKARAFTVMLAILLPAIKQQLKK
jgi:magnesium transporter